MPAPKRARTTVDGKDTSAGGGAGGEPPAKMQWRSGGAEGGVRRRAGREGGAARAAAGVMAVRAMASAVGRWRLRARPPCRTACRCTYPAWVVGRRRTACRRSLCTHRPLHTPHRRTCRRTTIHNCPTRRPTYRMTTRHTHPTRRMHGTRRRPAHRARRNTRTHRLASQRHGAGTHRPLRTISIFRLRTMSTAATRRPAAAVASVQVKSCLGLACNPINIKKCFICVSSPSVL